LKPRDQAADGDDDVADGNGDGDGDCDSDTADSDARENFELCNSACHISAI
jgi:hypothetical protein